MVGNVSFVIFVKKMPQRLGGTSEASWEKYSQVVIKTYFSQYLAFGNIKKEKASQAGGL